ncbi:MAG: hypothetical protein Kow0020_08320 [Wenzhouxiangellaceae bacterium]
MIRDRIQEALQELELHSRTLLERVQKLEAGQLCPERPSALSTLLERRRRLWRGLADLSQAHGDLPRAEDLEGVQWQSVLDQLLKRAGGIETVRARLAGAERSLAERIDALRGLDWRPEERELLDALAGNAEDIAGLLENGRPRNSG